MLQGAKPRIPGDRSAAGGPPRSTKATRRLTQGPNSGCSRWPITGEITPSHQFNNKIDAGIVDDAHSVVGEDTIGDGEVPRFGEISDRDALHTEVETGLSGYCSVFVHEARNERSPNRSRPEDADANR